MPKLDFGRSLICPLLAMTLYSEPKKFFIVLAFAGDSTIINLLIILPQIQLVVILPKNYKMDIKQPNKYLNLDHNKGQIS